MWKAEKQLLQLYRGLAPNVQFEMTHNGHSVYSEMCISVLDSYMCPKLSNTLLEYEEQSEIVLPACKFLRICFLNMTKKELNNNTFKYYDKTPIPETTWHMSSFYCAYTRYPNIPDHEKALFKGSGKQMFDNTVLKIEKLPIIIEAEAGIHTSKEKHKLFKLYEELGFNIIGPYNADYAHKKLKERIRDNEDVSSLGVNEVEQIDNLRWSTCLMMRKITT